MRLTTFFDHLEGASMIRSATLGALVALPLALAVGACQTGDDYTTSTESADLPIASPAPTTMDGSWSSNDGVFVATFAAGNFTSRFTQTNEVLAQGTYTVSGNTVTMQWMSVQTQQQRSATCTIMAPDSVSCSQAGGGRFDLKRSA
jgi:hypothetical protein